MTTPATIPAFLQLQRRAAGIVATAQSSVASARTAITWSLGLSILALGVATGAAVYAGVTSRRR
jgi:hypothetical protein